MTVKPMYKITTCTGRTVEEHIKNFEAAKQRLHQLEFDMKRINDYHPWYYRIEIEETK